MSSNKIVRVTYIIEEEFLIPNNINLEDETQVKWWGVKYNVLHILLVNGKELKINGRDNIHNFDYKYPSGTYEPEIVDAADVGIDSDDEGFEDEELEDEPI